MLPNARVGSAEENLMPRPLLKCFYPCQMVVEMMQDTLLVLSVVELNTVSKISKRKGNTRRWQKNQKGGGGGVLSFGAPLVG